jgi:hypothetical protein
MHTGFWWGHLSEREHLEDPDIDWRTILKWVFRKWIDLAQDRDRWQELCKCSNETSGSIGEFHD